MSNHFLVFASSGEDDTSSDEDEVFDDPVSNEALDRNTRRAAAAEILQQTFRLFLARQRQHQRNTAAEELECAARLQAQLQAQEQCCESVSTDEFATDDVSVVGRMFVEVGDETPQFAAHKAILFNTQFSQVRFFGRCCGGGSNIEAEEEEAAAGCISTK